MAADGQFTSFRIVTEDLPVEDRLSVLREVYGKTILKADLEPVDDSPVQMDMRVRLLPGIGIATGTASPIKVGVKSEMIENDDIILLAALAGGSHMQIGKQEESVLPGCAMFVPGGRTGANVTRPGFTYVNLRFERKALQPLVGDVSKLMMRPIAVDQGPMHLLLSYATALQQLDDALPGDMARKVASHLLDLTALTLGATREAEQVAIGRGLRAARLAAIKADISARADLRGLSAEAVAAEHRLSARYVRKLFEGEGLSFTAFALGQRLMRAHRMLADPIWAGHSIIDIAYEAGFNDLSYFNRAFRKRYGVTPSDIRAGVLAA
ncbi:Virulence regulon transcriptional activator VirF [Aminobacter sp. MSH1]|uniref:AraC family transcriptional regulator n=1 Tax=Aminobacter sp. MSH1 TaxID=374606 RepID=UPI000D38A103|nr:helix-turn-helix domain-containing protein [Aminobacter sp. MSH1]AWC21662.1 Virulence regulon transcriptional activator VirF [Aminobacter sp. MSH1]